MYEVSLPNISNLNKLYKSVYNKFNRYMNEMELVIFAYVVLLVKTRYEVVAITDNEKSTKVWCYNDCNRYIKNQIL